jgi:uncharacterized protein YqgC (DUF456 family)
MSNRATTVLCFLLALALAAVALVLACKPQAPGVSFTLPPKPATTP